MKLHEKIDKNPFLFFDIKVAFISQLKQAFLGPFLFLPTTEEGTVEDKKFINPKRGIREKFCIQKVGVTKVFLLVKMVSDFDFGHFLEK